MNPGKPIFFAWHTDHETDCPVVIGVGETPRKALADKRRQIRLWEKSVQKAAS